jgi:hypothetical protein
MQGSSVVAASSRSCVSVASATVAGGIFSRQWAANDADGIVDPSVRTRTPNMVTASIYSRSLTRVFDCGDAWHGANALADACPGSFGKAVSLSRPDRDALCPVTVTGKAASNRGPDGSRVS